MAVALSRFGVGCGEMQTWALSITRGWELPSLATSNAKMARKPRAAAQASQGGSRLGFGYRHPWCLEVIKKQEKGGCQGGRDARSWDWCRRQSRNSLIETSSTDLVRISLEPFFFVSGNAHCWSQCLNCPLLSMVVI